MSDLQSTRPLSPPPPFPGDPDPLEVPTPAWIVERQRLLHEAATKICRALGYSFEHPIPDLLASRLGRAMNALEDDEITVPSLWVCGEYTEYRVLSRARGNTYLVSNLRQVWQCTCPDWQKRSGRNKEHYCKHIFAVMLIRELPDSFFDFGHF